MEGDPENDVTRPPDDTRNAIRGVRARLRRLRRAGRALLATRVVSLLSIAAIGAVLLLVLGDLVLRFPAALRGVWLAGLVALAVWAFRRVLLPITRFRPPLSDVAIRVERWMAQHGATDAHAGREDRGVIASGIGVPIDDPDDLTRGLSRIVADRAARRLTATPWAMLRWTPALGSLAMALIIMFGVSRVILIQPELAVTGLTRLFAPWRDTPWPKRTEIADTTPSGVHPADTGLPVRALLRKSNRPAGEATITVEYRVIDADGAASPAARAVLTPQPTSADPGSTPEAGELYERLIEPTVWQNAGASWIEYTLISEDDSTPPRRVRLVAPPVLVSRTTTVDPPAYARGSDADFVSGSQTEPAPPAGRAFEVGPLLPGSRLTLELAYSKDVEPIASDDTPPGAVISADGGTVRIEWTPDQTSQLELNARDTFGLQTRHPTTIRVGVTPDTPPGATVLEPEADDVVLPTAEIPLGGEGRDDIGLSSVALDLRLARPDPSSLSGEPTPVPDKDPEILVSIEPAGGRVAEARTRLVIAEHGVEPGDELWVRAVARDTFDLAGRAHDPVYSAPRRLRVITPARFVELMQAELEGVRRTAIRLDRLQADLIDKADASSRDPEAPGAEPAEQLAARQSGLSRRLRAQSGMLDKLARRADRNGLDDETMRELIRGARGAVSRAADDSDRAAERLAEQKDELESPAKKDQQAVRDELAQLISRLDRGQDGWLVRRNIEQLLGEERALREQTSRVAERTVGESVSELSPADRTELERIAERQRDLAERASDAIDQLSERADAIREKDPTQASAMDRAAEDAARERLAEKLREAADQIGQNQTASGGQMQEQSIEAMQEMLDQLTNAQRHRDEALRRQLASVIQTIENLIRQQHAAIDALAGDDPGPPIERVHTNTLAAESDTRGGFPELARAADLLARAGVSQAGAIASLRGDPPEIDPASAQEHEALARLDEALAEAKRQDDEARKREQARKRRELRDAYRDALAEQVEIGAQTGTFVGLEMDRRARARLRGVGQRQEALRTAIKAIPEQHEIEDIGALSLYHGRIDRVLTEAVRAMGRGVSDDKVLARQAAAADMLRAIVETLTPGPDEPGDSFENAAGGGGGGGQSGEKPPVGNLEQLMLLRNLQSIILEQTRAGETDGLAPLQRDVAEQTRRLVEQMHSKPNPDTPEPGTHEGGGR